jgi:transcriptional regulator with XRE-family HTH domain
MLLDVATRETRAAAGRRRGKQLATGLLEQLRQARIVANLSLRSVAREMGWSHERYARFESGRLARVALADLTAVGAVLGLDLSAAFHPAGEAIRDAGQQALAVRFRALLSPLWRVTAEVLLPNPGDRRSWDLLLRLAAQLVGVELETRVRDVQWLTRRMRERERDGGADHVLLVLSASAHNRRVLLELLEALGPEFATSPRVVLRALREGTPIPGSAVILV